MIFGNLGSLYKASSSMIEEEPMEASPMPFRCSICKHDFASKYLLKKHAKDCYETTEEQIHEDEEGGKKKCDHCGGSFALQGGWLTKHMKSCQQQNNQSLTDGESINEENGEGRKECPHCGKTFATTGGWFTKHLSRCQQAPDEQKQQQYEVEESSTCPTCGKWYAPNCRHFLKSHVLKCGVVTNDIPIPATTLEASSSSAAPRPKPEQDVQLPEGEDMSVYEQMYKRGEWNCFMCAKWFGRRDVLRQHLIIHYKKEIRKQYMSNGEDTNNVCTICGDETRDAKALLQARGPCPAYTM